VAKTGRLLPPFRNCGSVVESMPLSSYRFENAIGDRSPSQSGKIWEESRFSQGDIITDVSSHDAETGR